MLKAERLQAIVDITNKEKIVTSEELMRQLNISKATARRDIEELSSQGLIQKTRGGAMSANHASLEPSFVKKKESNADEKARIAKAAREHISPGEKIILDSGTTVLELAKLVNDIPDLTVVTNDLHIASEVSIFPNATLLMVGGVVRKGFNSTYGYFAEKMLGSISVNKTFLSIDAVDMEQGLLSYITDDTNIKKQYIKSGKEVILLCDHTKFQASAFINISQLDCIHRIIVGKELDGEYVERLESMGIDMELV